MHAIYVVMCVICARCENSPRMCDLSLIYIDVKISQIASKSSHRGGAGSFEKVLKRSHERSLFSPACTACQCPQGLAGRFVVSMA